MVKPSRQFMVQQAVLNASSAEWGTYKPRHIPTMLRLTTKDGVVCPAWLFKAILRAYRELENRYAQ